MKKFVIALVGPALLAACADGGNDAAEDRVEEAAEASAAAAGPAQVALGLSEAELIDADLVGANNVELGDVTSLVRGAGGEVEGLLVEIEDSNPDRFVQVPLTGLSVVTRGNDRDLSTTMTREQLVVLPDAPLPAR